MYHYVKEFDKDYPHFRFLDLNNFKNQLNFFEKEYGFVSKDEWLNYIKGHGMKSGKGKIILTFDDALSCHYEYVFPELMKRNLWGIFFITTKPFIDFKLLNTHKIHLLCGVIEGKKLLSSLMKLVTNEMILNDKRKEFHNQTYTKQNNYPGVTNFKRILNYFIAYKNVEPLINEIASQFNYVFNVNNFYISQDNLKKMKQNGMLIGSHTHNHPIMSRLTKDEQSTQISESFKYLKKIGCLTDKIYAHPYGGYHTFNKNTTDLLLKESVAYSFNVESRDIEEDDINKFQHSLPRFDCNEFSHGQSS